MPNKKHGVDTLMLLASVALLLLLVGTSTFMVKNVNYLFGSKAFSGGNESENNMTIGTTKIVDERELISISAQLDSTDPDMMESELTLLEAENNSIK